MKIDTLLICFQRNLFSLISRLLYNKNKIRILGSESFSRWLALEIAPVLVIALEIVLGS